MHFLIAHKWLSTSLLTAAVVLLVLLWQVLYITLHYSASVAAPAIPRGTEHFGASGSKLNFVVMGDSTSIAQGAAYERGIARMSAVELAKTHQVSLTNVGVSGARVADVRATQLAKAVALKPDLVLLAIGANDVTHLTPLGSFRTNTVAIIAQLQVANPNVQIIMTGSPAMGSVARFAPPTQWLAGWRVRHINALFTSVAAQQKHVTVVPLAAKTAAAFKHNPGLFAPDNFHPNAAGYALWQPIVSSGLRGSGY